MKKSLMIFKIITQIWIKEINCLLYNRARKVVCISALGIIIFFAVISGYFLSNGVLELFLTGDNKAIYLLLISELVTASIFAFAFFVLIKCITPDENKLNKILSWLPIKVGYRQIGLNLPILFNITIGSLAFTYSLFLPSMFMNKISILIIFLFMVILMIQVLLILFILSSLYNFSIYIFAKMKIPFSKTLATSISILTCVYYLFQFLIGYTDMLINYRLFDYNPLTIAGALFLLFFNKGEFVSINYLYIVAFFVIVPIIFIGTLFLKSPINEKNALKVFRKIPFSNFKICNLIIKEIKIEFRNEENFLFILLIVIGSLVFRVFFGFTIASKYTCIYLSILSTVISLSSFGMEEHLIPFYRQLGINKYQYSITKVLGCIISSSILYLMLNIIMFSTQINISSFMLGFLMIISVDLILYLVGVIVPINGENAHLQGTSIFVVILGALPLAYIISKSSIDSIIFIVLAVMFIDITIFLIIIHVTSFRWNK